MDPNATLVLIRALLVKMDTSKATPSDEEFVTLYETFFALDNWLKKGGFLPKEWNNGRN